MAKTLDSWRWGWLVGLLLTCLFVASDARAESFYCGNQLVRTGDSLARVRARCGEPAARQQRVEQRVWRYGHAIPTSAPSCRSDGGQSCWVPRNYGVFTVLIDEWTYDRGPRRLTQRLVFEQGTLVRIEAGGYGAQPASSAQEQATERPGAGQAR